MRDRTKRLLALHEEYLALRAKLFGEESFIVVDDTDPRWESFQRFNTLLALFSPEHRSAGWKNPLE